jgi:hypothetical protein
MSAVRKVSRRQLTSYLVLGSRTADLLPVDDAGRPLDVT